MHLAIEGLLRSVHRKYTLDHISVSFTHQTWEHHGRRAGENQARLLPSRAEPQLPSCKRGMKTLLLQGHC